MAGPGERRGGLPAPACPARGGGGGTGRQPPASSRDPAAGRLRLPGRGTRLLNRRGAALRASSLHLARAGEGAAPGCPRAARGSPGITPGRLPQHPGSRGGLGGVQQLTSPRIPGRPAALTPQRRALQRAPPLRGFEPRRRARALPRARRRLGVSLPPEPWETRRGCCPSGPASSILLGGAPSLGWAEIVGDGPLQPSCWMSLERKGDFFY